MQRCIQCTCIAPTLTSISDAASMLAFGESVRMIEREEEEWKSMMNSMHDASQNSQVLSGIC